MSKLKNFINHIINKRTAAHATATVAVISALAWNVGNVNEETETLALTPEAQERQQHLKTLLAATPAQQRWDWGRSNEYLSQWAFKNEYKMQTARIKILNNDFFCENANADFIVDLIRQAQKKAAANNQTFTFCYKSIETKKMDEENKAHQDFIKEIDEDFKSRTPELEFKNVKIRME